MATHAHFQDAIESAVGYGAPHLQFAPLANFVGEHGLRKQGSYGRLSKTLEMFQRISIGIGRYRMKFLDTGNDFGIGIFPPIPKTNPRQDFK